MKKETIVSERTESTGYIEGGLSICSNDEEHHFEYIDRSLWETLGFKEEEFKQKISGGFFDLFPEGCRSEIQKQIKEKKDTETFFSFECNLFAKEREICAIIFLWISKDKKWRVLLREVTDVYSQLTEENRKEKILSSVVAHSGMSIFEYKTRDDILYLYDSCVCCIKKYEDYLKLLHESGEVHPQDQWKLIATCQGKLRGPLEIRIADGDGYTNRLIEITLVARDSDGQNLLIGSIRDITEEKIKAKLLEERSMRDSLTSLYNNSCGKELINQYLQEKNPYESCGMMVVDIDYFKNVNDNYGHLFGDKALVQLSNLLAMIFDENDIIVRAGGDEFVILLKNISHTMLVKKAMDLVESIPQMVFEENDYSMTCSVGVCFLPENVSGYTYEQIFENADWALYRAKEGGRNRYVFCDNLPRFTMMEQSEETGQSEIDGRYLHNDLVSTAFEIFEKTNSFDAAAELLMKVIGVRLHLDRITILSTNTKDQQVSRLYQWTSDRVPEVLHGPGSFSKDDFLTLFHSYDEYGTAVLHYDQMSMYSDAAAELLMQGGAKTVVYAAMYCEGRYTGAISYVVCNEKRYWSKGSRKQLGEVTKILSAHLAKQQVANACHQSVFAEPDYDALSGLLSFSRFKEETERIILGGYGVSRAMVYMDFDGFKYFNRRYGYSTGDRLLKEFSNYIIEALEPAREVYFTRVVADQFILFVPYEDLDALALLMVEIQQSFVKAHREKYPQIRMGLRIGIYPVDHTCSSAAEAIDAADYARKQARAHSGCPVKIFDEAMAREQQLENEIINGLDAAMANREFKIFLQPRFSLKTQEIIGAEALVRWVRPQGDILTPAAFLPLYEANGRILDLDYYVYEEVARFLAKNKQLHRRQVPISVNTSSQHVHHIEETRHRFLQILNKYDINPELTEIELTETATIRDHNAVYQFLETMQEAKIRTTLDDYGAGYSSLNTVVDIPVETVKLDRSFINRCETSSRGVYFLQQIMVVVKGLGYRVVCEGVETREQADLLEGAGCEEVQGYWFAQPMTIEEYEAFMYGEKAESN